MWRLGGWSVLLALVLLALPVRGAEARPGEIAWHPWSASVFAQAKREHKFVLLDLEAGWCHWCHVMDDRTYSDPKVIALIRARYMAVKVNQDSRPDLANRYEDYGWPATVIFNADAGEIVKRQGFLPPRQMESILQSVIDDPSPGPSVTNDRSPHFDAAAARVDVKRIELETSLISHYDFALGGWSSSHRFLDWDNVEWAMVRAQTGYTPAVTIAKQMLAQQQKLIDPVWGGVYQYSIDDWDHPHFEKLIQMQAENLRIYSLASIWMKDPTYLQAARKISDYVAKFLISPDGALFTSQDADIIDGQPPESYYKLGDGGRRQIGIPRIDQHVYARENGWYIQGQLAFYAATRDPHQLAMALRAARWIVKNYELPDGGFRHGSGIDDDRLYLGDTLEMGRGALALYAATADPAWLVQAERAAAFIRIHFAYAANGQRVGFATAEKLGAEKFFAPTPEFDENVALARFANLLFHYSANAPDRDMAKTALRFCAAPDVLAHRGGYVGGLLLADQDLQSEPLHLVILGAKNDPAAASLFQAAIFHPTDYEQIEWFDRAHPPAGVDLSFYPALPHPSAFLCANQACSAPVVEPDGLVALIGKRVTDTARSGP